MMMKCDICGHEFDHTEGGECDCGYGCAGGSVKCPECGIHVDLPEELQEEHIRKKEENSVFARMERKLNEL
ncbi:MAG: hypothetical protein LUG89_03060 [Methanosphaera sp.]|nr:hypothetical protein [Methanosphaera sp.]